MTPASWPAEFEKARLLRVIGIACEGVTHAEAMRVRSLVQASEGGCSVREIARAAGISATRAHQLIIQGKAPT